MKLNIIVGNLFDVRCDALVNPTDTELSGNGGLDRQFHQRCGTALAKELDGEKLDVGKLVFTSGCGLPVRYILHVAVPNRSDETTATWEKLEACCQNIAADVSWKKDVRHLAMPLIGTGYAGYSLSDTYYPGMLCSMAAVCILAGLIRGVHLGAISSPQTRLREITVVCSSEENRACMQRALDTLLGRGLDARSRARGCLLGGAIGDALGYPLEFRKPSEFPEIVSKTWNRMDDAMILDEKTGKAVISDDTQMTLFTACGLLFWETRGRLRGVGANEWDYIRMAYEDWLKTQDESFHFGREPVSWISKLPQMYVRRVPGNTCLSALYDGGGSLQKPINNSKGSGGVMRIAPIPLFMATRRLNNKDYVMRVCAEAAAITHGHPLGWLSAAAMGYLLYDIMLNFSLSFALADTIQTLQRVFGNYPETKVMVEKLEEAEREADITGWSSDVNLNIEFGTSSLGEGWVGEETLALGLFYVLACQGRGVDLCLLNAVKHKGDSDTVGSVAGQIWGAYFGVESFSQNPKLLEALELKDVVLEVADDLVDGCKMSEYSPYWDNAWMEKYLLTADSSEHLPGSGRHWYLPFPSKPGAAANLYCTLAEKNPDGSTKTVRIPYQIQLIPQDENMYEIRYVSRLQEAAEDGMPEFGVLEKAESHPDTQMFSCSHGWVSRGDDGSVQGYYHRVPFRLLPDHANRTLEIFIDLSSEPWEGTIRQRLSDWEAPLELELRHKPEDALPQVMALAAAELCLDDGCLE